jgi:uncharacterized protein
MLSRPADLHDRTTEWNSLSEFVLSLGAGPRLGTVHGRRRQGKTTLIDAVCEAADGFYWSASQQSSGQQLADFSDAWSRFAGAQPMRFASWGDALTAILSVGTPDRPVPVALDEVSWLIEAEPALPSLLQRLLHPRTPAGAEAGARLLLCGSDLGAMRRLVDAQAPLRGRTSLELVVQPFAFRDAAEFWGLIGNPDAAFRLHSYIGGTPAYKQFAGGASPKRGNVDEWVVSHVLNPSSPLFRDGRTALAEDPSLGDRVLYGALLSAIASGSRSRGEIAEAVGRESGAIAHPIGVLVSSGWIERYDDPLRGRGGGWRLTEPLVRLHRLVIEPAESRLLAGNARKVWDAATSTIASRIHGPHLEALASEWILAHASETTIGGSADSVGSSTLTVAGQSMQLDVVVAERSGSGQRKIIAIGECKAEATPVGEHELDRLDAAAAVVTSRWSLSPKRMLFARAGFTLGLRRAADRRDDVELIDLHRLYSGQ